MRFTGIAIPLWIVTLYVLACESYHCGSGPYPVSLRSKRFTVYQKSQRKVLLSNNDSVETHAFGWRVMKGKSHLNYSQLGSLRKSHLVSKKANGVRILAINLTPELDGLRVRFQFDATKENTNLTKLESSWVELRVSSPLKISLGRNSSYLVQNGQNASVCANISGIPSIHATVEWTRDEAKINESLYKYDGKCWTFDKSVVKNGGYYTIVARNCLYSTNASFFIRAPDQGSNILYSENPASEWILLRRNFEQTNEAPTSAMITSEFQVPGTTDKGTTSETTNVAVWVYIVIGVGLLFILAVLVILLSLKFCRKNKNYSDHYVNTATRSHSWVGNSFKLADSVASEILYDQPEVVLTAFTKVESLFTNKGPEIPPETDTPRSPVYYDTVAPDEPESTKSGSTEGHETASLSEQETSDEPVGQYSYITVPSLIQRERKSGSQFLKVDVESLRKQLLQEVIQYDDVDLSVERQGSPVFAGFGSVEYSETNKEQPKI